MANGTLPPTVYVVVEFTYPEGDWPGEFDYVVGVYTDRPEAERVAAEHKMRSVREADFYAPPSFYAVVSSLLATPGSPE